MSYHQGCHGIEIRNNSLTGDGSHSWVRISTGMNKYVMEMSETVSSSFETVDGASARRPFAKSRQKQTSSGTSSSGPQSRTDIPIHERKWIDVEPEENNEHSFSVAKEMIKSLRHELFHLREEDGAIAFKILAPMLVSQFESSPYWSIRTWLNHLQIGG